MAQYKYVLRIFGLILLLAVVFMKFNSIRLKWGLVLIACYAAGMTVLGSSDLTGNAINMIAIIIVMFASQCVEYDDMLRIFYEVAALSIVVFLTGQIEITAWEATRQAGVGESMHTIHTVRYSLGFLYEINLCGGYLASALTIILLYKEVSKRNVIVVSALNVLIYMITDSRTTFGFYLTFLVRYCLLRIYKKRNSIIDFFNRGVKSGLCSHFPHTFCSQFINVLDFLA